MLKKVTCELLPQKNITFHKGANFILGDENASNSIGKTTALLLIDFVFGGMHYAESEEIIGALGHHSVDATFNFLGKDLQFTRTTEDRNTVYQLIGTENIKLEIEDYRLLLLRNYGFDDTHLSFRDAVGLYSRIWGKKNTDPLKPLHTVPNESDSKTIERLVKLFEKYGEVETSAKQVTILGSELSALSKTQENEYLPKVNQREVKLAEKRLVDIKAAIARITTDLTSSRENAESLLTPEMVRLKSKRTQISEELDSMDARLKRLDSSMEKSKSKRRIEAQLEELRSYFPDVKLKKVSEVESFHDDIDGILTKYITAEKQRLNKLTKALTSSLSEIDESFNKLLTGNRNPGEIEVEELTLLIADRINNEQVINLYQKKKGLTDNLSGEKAKKKEAYLIALGHVGKVTNETLAEVSSDVLPSSKPPYLSLSPSSYSYEVEDDSGTGRAYAALVIFDYVVLELTALPFFMHDSIILKNIERTTLSNIMDRYFTIMDKQVFVSLDEIHRFSKETSDQIKALKVIELSETNTLFGAAWLKGKK